MDRSVVSLSLDITLGLAACSSGARQLPPTASLVSGDAGGSASGVPTVSRTGSVAFTHTTTCAGVRLQVSRPATGTGTSTPAGVT